MLEKLLLIHDTYHVKLAQHTAKLHILPLKRTNNMCTVTGNHTTGLTHFRQQSQHHDKLHTDLYTIIKTSGWSYL